MASRNDDRQKPKTPPLTWNGTAIVRLSSSVPASQLTIARIGLPVDMPSVGAEAAIVL